MNTTKQFDKLNIIFHQLKEDNVECRFNSVPAMVQQLGSDIHCHKTPHSIKFNKILVLETVRDFCNLVLSVHGRDTTNKPLTR